MNGKTRRRGWGRRLLSAALSLLLAAGPVLSAMPSALAAGADSLSLDNGYILAELTKENGCFEIRTLQGDKVNKDDNNKNLLFPNEGDATSFTSFQVTRGGQTKEYIFGGAYEGSSKVTVEQTANELIAKWSVDSLTFTQTLSLVNSGSNEHGMVYLSYTVANTGAPAEIKARVLLDTALGNQDYAYYRMGKGEPLQSEIELGEDGYDKVFYCYDDPFDPKITAYLVNASLNDTECKPYKTVLAHWNNLAATAFDYTPDKGMTFTNFNNKQYLTADSACALYYNMGTVASNSSGAVALNYGVYSNERATAGQSATVNVTAPDAMELTADSKTYQKDGVFTVTTTVKNVGPKTYEKARIVLYTAGALQVLDENGAEVKTSLDQPYYREVNDFVPGQTQTLTWNLKALPQAEGVYASATFKVYDVSGSATQGTGELVAENLMGEGSAWVLCPGTVNKVPQIQFTGSSPEVLYSSGRRTFYVAGKNLNMLGSEGTYSLMLSRLDGEAWNGQTAVAIPSNRINIDTEKNTMTVTLDDELPGELPEGQYRLTIDYTGTDKKDITAPALQFAVKQEEKYRNETYGLLVAVKSGTNYSIQTYADEAAYQSALTGGSLDRDSALLEFRGIFSKRTQSGKTVYTGTSSGSGDNVMTLNSCLDFEDGSVTITEQNNSVTVDFDASIYTTGSRTSVWKGVAALTELEAGADYGLIQYDKDGNRTDEPDNTITLLWPSVGQAAQNLLGFLMEFKYGELGVIKGDGAAETRVVGFGAAMNLSFVIPNSQETVDDQSVLGDAYNASIQGGGYPSASEIRTLNKQIPYNVDTVNTNAQDGAEGEEEDGGGGGIAGSIQIDDVLFGGGFLGVNMQVALSVPAYIEGTPSLVGVLTLKTVGNWEVGVSGSCDFSVFCMEGEIAIKSRNNIPVPDKIRFFLGNCTPGICLDPCGVLWLQGAGGGIENLYDTIFLTDSVPPLKLILEAQFSLMQVISARATLSLSLRGIGVTLTNGTVANVVPVLDSASVQVDWYPEFYFLSSVVMDVKGVIYGGGYIVVEQDGFFEFFVKASVKVPGEIPIIGGMTVASAGLGANAEKVWGQLKAMGVTLGVVYYWGGSLEWGGGAEAEPTYPGLVSRAAYQNLPVYTDRATGRTLYAAVGTNLLPGAVVGAATPGNNSLTDNKDGSYTLTLGQKTKDELLLLEWPAASLDAAKTDMENVTLTSGGTSKTIRLLDQKQPADQQPNANANLTFNKNKGEETGMATLAISFTNSGEFDKSWAIKAPAEASVVLYDLEPMPELTGATEPTVTGDQMAVTLAGTGLNKFDSVSFIAVSKASGDATLLYKVRRENGGSISASQTLSLPVDLPSGDYELRIVAGDEGQYHSELTKEFTYTNSNAPAAPTGVSAQCTGDYKLAVTVGGTGDFDGYRVDVYDQSGAEVAGVSGLLFTRDGRPVAYNDDGSLALPQDNTATSATVTVGGQYQLPDDAAGKPGSRVGLVAGKTYQVKVSTWKQITVEQTPGESRTLLLYSGESDPSTVTMKEKVNTTFTFSANAASMNVEEERTAGSDGRITFTTPTYKANSLNLTVVASQAVSGTWKLDGKPLEEGTVTNQPQKTLTLTGLAEGVHTLEFIGKGASGDTAAAVYTFAVDTLPPRLMLSSPVSGSFFDDETGVTLEGITDPDVKLTVEDVLTGQKWGTSPVVTDQEGRFSQTVEMDSSYASRTLLITAEDAVGNQTQQTVELLNSALGSIETLSITNGNGEADLTNQAIASGRTDSLVLMATLKDGTKLELNDDTMVEWSLTQVSGNATLSEADGAYSLTTEAHSRGMVSARFLGNDLGSISAAFAYAPDGEEPPAPSDGSSSSSGGTRHTITISAGQGGTISPSGTVTVRRGGSKTFTITPDEGYVIADVLVDGVSVGAVSRYTLEKVTGGHTIEVRFSKVGDGAACLKNETCPAHPFTDLVLSAWYHDGIHFCVERGLMIGMSDTTFAPETPTSRAMIATILWRLQGSPVVNYAMDYTDVPQGAWYAEAVRWATSEGVVKGYGDGVFAPDDPITREQLATMLYRYEQKYGKGGFTGNWMFLLDYADRADISEWAYEALCWMTMNKVMEGKGEKVLDPRGKATRAQAAAMLQRYLQL